MGDGFLSPEDAALDGYPRRYCYVVAARQQGDHAYVLLNTGTDNRRYLYGVNCVRQDGRWYEDGSANTGGGWRQIGQDPAVGILSVWDDAPEGADAVRLEFAGVTAVRIGGQWVPHHGPVLDCPPPEFPFPPADADDRTSDDEQE